MVAHQALSGNASPRLATMHSPPSGGYSTLVPGNTEEEPTATAACVVLNLKEASDEVEVGADEVCEEFGSVDDASSSFLSCVSNLEAETGSGQDLLLKSAQEDTAVRADDSRPIPESPVASRRIPSKGEGFDRVQELFFGTTSGMEDPLEQTDSERVHCSTGSSPCDGSSLTDAVNSGADERGDEIALENNLRSCSVAANDEADGADSEGSPKEEPNDADSDADSIITNPFEETSTSVVPYYAEEDILDDGYFDPSLGWGDDEIAEEYADEGDVSDAGSSNSKLSHTGLERQSWSRHSYIGPDGLMDTYNGRVKRSGAQSGYLHQCTWQGWLHEEDQPPSAGPILALTTPDLEVRYLDDPAEYDGTDRRHASWFRTPFPVPPRTNDA
ncbi:hypothetical protein QBC35DRAFT_82682 [Podospora australis]|uniref:Uncharacterized protein n=1 Tax=Podospora australis TaxID=1536484 RepID=A0AAN6WKZ0_9PEZI|nr:hypothetical protein QBC35DRAFT_82682 [Podospora australis]